MTWSILAREPDGRFGIAIASRFFSVGSLCIHSRAGVGAIATQALMNPLYGPQGLALLAQGLSVIGAEALVMPSDLGDKGVWYRVRLGPYNRIEDLDRVRGQLAQNGIQSSLVRIKDSDAQK